MVSFKKQSVICKPYPHRKYRGAPLFLFFLVAIASVVFTACNSKSKSKVEIKIGFSQCTSEDEWRKLMNQEIARECKLVDGYDIELVTKDAQNNSQKQVEDIKELIEEKVDVLIVSPNEAKPLTPVIESVFLEGIPVIVVDRKINSQSFSAFVGADNYLIGKEAGSYAAELLKGKGNILEVFGLEGSTPAIDRSKGFHQSIAQFENIHITHTASGKWNTQLGEKVCDSIFAIDKKIDLVYCHNDFMAQGAYAACVANKFFPKIIGIDGLSFPNGGIDMVIQKKIAATFLYPSGGAKAVQLAVDVFSRKPYSKYNNLFTVRIDTLNAHTLLFQANQIKDQFDNIDQQQLLIGKMKHLLQRQMIFLVLSIAITLLIAVVVILILVLLRNKNKTNALLRERNSLIESQNEEIKTQRDNLEDLNETKDKLFTIIAHDLINPFNIILGYADLLKSNAKISSKEIIEEQANAILQASDDAYNLLNNLLHWARSQQKVIQFNVKPVVISQILEMELKILRKQAENKKVEIYVKIEGEEKEVAADKNLISIVIRNLISNAIKFSNPGNNIYVLLNFKEKELIFSVHDEGVGMSTSQLENLFKVKTKSSTRGTNGEKGTGLGLILCKDFIEKHNGKLWVESEVNMGSTFYFSLSYC